MKNLLYLLTILTVLFSMTSCPSKDSENCHNYYTFINNSNKTIRLVGSISYPDSSIIDGIGSNSNIVSPKEQMKIKKDGCYEVDFELGLIFKHGVMMIFLFDEEVFKKYSYDEIREKQLWLKKYDMRLEDFQRMNWTITYP